MKKLMWVAQNTLLDAWEARGSLARAWAPRAALACALLALGLASHALWEMAFNGGRDVGGRSLAEVRHARVESCERELAGLPGDLRDGGEFWARGSPPRFACRKEGGVEFVERRAGGGPFMGGSLASLAKARPELRRFERLDKLGWSDSWPRASWAGFLEALGAKELSAASRGIEASTSVANEGWAHGALWRAATGLLKGLGLALWAAAAGWPVWIWLGALGLCVVTAKAIGGERLSKMSAWRRRAWLGASGLAGAAALGAALMALNAGGLMALEALGSRLREPAREFWGVSTKLADCEERREGAARSMGTHYTESLACREQDGEMAATWIRQGAGGGRSEAMMGQALGARDLKWGPASQRKGSWGAFKELSGWAPATRATEAWADQTPRVWEGARLSWDRLASISGAAFQGFVFLCGLLAALGLLALLGSWLWDAAKIVGGRLEQVASRWEEDPEFRARAESRMLRRGTRAGSASEGSGGEPKKGPGRRL